MQDAWCTRVLDWHTVVQVNVPDGRVARAVYEYTRTNVAVLVLESYNCILYAVYYSI